MSRSGWRWPSHKVTSRSLLWKSLLQLSHSIVGVIPLSSSPLSQSSMLPTPRRDTTHDSEIAVTWSRWVCDAASARSFDSRRHLGPHVGALLSADLPWATGRTSDWGNRAPRRAVGTIVAKDSVSRPRYGYDSGRRLGWPIGRPACSSAHVIATICEIRFFKNKSKRAFSLTK